MYKEERVCSFFTVRGNIKVSFRSDNQHDVLVFKYTMCCEVSIFNNYCNYYECAEIIKW